MSSEFYAMTCNMKSSPELYQMKCVSCSMYEACIVEKKMILVGLNGFRFDKPIQLIEIETVPVDEHSVIIKPKKQKENNRYPNDKYMDNNSNNIDTIILHKTGNIGQSTIDNVIDNIHNIIYDSNRIDKSLIK